MSLAGRQSSPCIFPPRTGHLNMPMGPTASNPSGTSDAKLRQNSPISECPLKLLNCVDHILKHTFTQAWR